MRILLHYVVLYADDDVGNFEILSLETAASHPFIVSFGERKCGFPEDPIRCSSSSLQPYNAWE